MPPKEEPNLEQTGALVADRNSYRGTVLKYSEPSESRMPTSKFRLYTYKSTSLLAELPLSDQSAYLIGRDRNVACIPMDHPSLSSQHAVIQYRACTSKNQYGDVVRSVKFVCTWRGDFRPFLIDLESTNGTFVNGVKMPSSRYVELMSGDSLKFGDSSRDYVFLCEDAV